MTDKQLVKRIIDLALKIKETEQLTKVSEELRTMEIEKMFPSHDRGGGPAGCELCSYCIGYGINPIPYMLCQVFNV